MYNISSERTIPACSGDTIRLSHLTNREKRAAEETQGSTYVMHRYLGNVRRDELQNPRHRLHLERRSKDEKQIRLWQRQSQGAGGRERGH